MIRPLGLRWKMGDGLMREGGREGEHVPLMLNNEKKWVTISGF